MHGKVAVRLTDGVVKDLKFQETIDKAITILEQTPLSPVLNDIAFSEVSGSGVLDWSVLTSNDFLFKSKVLRIKGSGQAYLENGGLNYRFVARLVKTLAPDGREAMPIVVNMTGNGSDPEYNLDMAAMLDAKAQAKIGRFFEKNKDKIENIKNTLDQQLGPGVGKLLKHLF